MAKMKRKKKSKKSLNKRVKVSKKGNIKRSQAFTSHLFSNKKQKVKRKLRKQKSVSKSDAKRYKDVL